MVWPNETYKTWHLKYWRQTNHPSKLKKKLNFLRGHQSLENLESKHSCPPFLLLSPRLSLTLLLPVSLLTLSPNSSKNHGHAGAAAVLTTSTTTGPSHGRAGTTPASHASRPWSIYSSSSPPSPLIRCY